MQKFYSVLFNPSTVSPQSKATKEHDTLARAERLTAAIAALEARKSQLESEGEVSPSGCYVARYQARGQRKTYWYYKLQAKTPIFPQQKVFISSLATNISDLPEVQLMLMQLSRWSQEFKLMN